MHMQRRNILRLVFIGGVWTPLLASAADGDNGDGGTGKFDAADEQRRQMQLDHMSEMSDQREQVREAQRQKLVLMSAMRPAMVEGQQVQSAEGKQHDIMKVVQEAAQALRQKQAISRLRSDFNEATERPFVEKPTKALDNLVNGWNEGVAPSCGGMRAVSGYIGDFCQGVSAFTEHYAFMLNANSETMVPRCDLRGEYREGRFKKQDKYHHCMANCESTEVGWMGEKVARSISWGREISDVAIKPAAAALSAYGVQRNTGADRISSGIAAANVYRSALSKEFAASIEDMEANNTGASAPGKGIRCRDACEGYRPFYIIPKP